MTKDVFSFIPVSFEALEISLSSIFNVVLNTYPFNMPILYVLICTIEAYMSNYILNYYRDSAPLHQAQNAKRGTRAAFYDPCVSGCYDLSFITNSGCPVCLSICSCSILNPHF